LLIIDAAYNAVMLVFSHLENYMRSLYPNIHSACDDWTALTTEAAAPYLPSTKESVQVSHLFMKHRVLARPQRSVKQWCRLKLFEAQVVEGKVAEYCTTFVKQLCYTYYRVLNFKMLCSEPYPTIIYCVSPINVRSLHRFGSIMTLSRELSKYKLYLVGIQAVRWDRGVTEPAVEYM
jgi:hypothetical protein